jgi:hypothetical protein
VRGKRQNAATPRGRAFATLRAQAAFCPGRENHLTRRLDRPFSYEVAAPGVARIATTQQKDSKK